MPSFNLDSTSSAVKLDSPVHVVDLPQQVLLVEFSPFEWSQNVILIAFPENVSIGTIKFQEEDESMQTKYKLDIVETFEVKGRPHALSLSQETLLTSNPKVMQFACASSDYNIYLHESVLKETVETKVLEGHTNYVNDICFDKESSVDLLASVSDDFTCRVWSVKDLKCSITFYLESPGTAVKWSADEPNKILVAEKKGIVRLYNVEQEQPVYSLECDVFPLLDVDWSPSNHCKIAGIASGYLLVWDTAKSSFPVYKQLVHSGGIKYVRYCNQNENIIATIGSPGHTLNVTNLKTKFPINVAKLKLASNVAWHFKLPYVCVGVDNSLCFWKVATK
ncbi:nucleoporin Nup37 [Planococcus citri]|uniref:nucleoporin Nup37 n=1 Tax=Planococcus citri TaxID=170843 RepID=UPI0031F96B9A